MSEVAQMFDEWDEKGGKCRVCGRRCLKTRTICDDCEEESRIYGPSPTEYNAEAEE